MPASKIDWDLVFSIAARAGVNYYAYHQWKHRGIIPHRWRNIIAIKSQGKISWNDMDAMDRRRGK